MIVLLVTCALLLAYWFHIKDCHPIIWEYYPGIFAIRSNGRYLDLAIYAKFGESIWKKDSNRLFRENCLTSNKTKLLGVLNDRQSKL